MATFTKDFMFEMEQTTSDWAAYRRFIEGLRRELTVRFNLSFSHNRPILPPQQNPPTQWSDINLKKLNENRDSLRVITLRIRMCNLYLDGYQMGTSEQWMDFGNNTTPKLIPGSSPLNFDGSYVTSQRVGGPRRDDVKLSQNNFKKVVYQLATSTDSEVRAQSLLVMIQMICESIRFIRISNYLATTFKQDLTAPDWMLALENGWGDLSAALLNADADPECGFYLPPDNPMHITMAEQAVAIIAMLVQGSPSERAFLDGVVKDGKYPQRRPLVEVFSVRINDNISGQDPVDLYGTITVTDGLGCQNIYNRKRENYESIHPGETALLTGPVRSISAYGSFTINVALMDDSERSPNDEFSDKQISWNVFNTTNEYDKLYLTKLMAIMVQ
ncbi:hypothetical protein L1049_013230 [Liquidambar formosana]|uniref:rRNA N-glycosylase n=1 Tax=Liquidambar formosana TaxID=63359 RepID=A0AAP0WWR1_LIQFO